jgi:hypothetical protein
LEWTRRVESTLSDFHLIWRTPQPRLVHQYKDSLYPHDLTVEHAGNALNFSPSRPRKDYDRAQESRGFDLELRQMITHANETVRPTF